MTHPRGPRNPKRREYTIERGSDNPRMAERFASELRSIMAALGQDAPDETARVTLLARGDRCFFGIGNGVYTWADGIAWKVHEAAGAERYEGWKDGRRIGTVDLEIGVPQISVGSWRPRG